jgi:glycosyltransferase involved in cell wall biosynthesis
MHLKNLKRIIWLQLIFSEDCVKESPAVSHAANVWQYEFIKSLKKLKIECVCVGHKYESAFPRGRLFVKTFKKDLAKDITNKSFNYINLPYFRNFFLKKNYYHYLKNFNFKKGDIILTYNDSFLSDVALKLKNNFNIPWISIVADLKAPTGSSGYVYFSWNYYKKNKDKYNKIHIDGGINTRSVKPNLKKNKNKIILYAGTIGGHAGVLHLIKAFKQIKNSDIELWLCGKGNDHDIKKLLYEDKRIKFFGYISKKRLEKLCHEADIFVNPRPSIGNETNFPSKILLYLSFKKPIISTRSGLSPKYNNVLYLLRNEKIQTLTEKLNQVVLLKQKQKKLLKNKIMLFNKLNTWDIHTKRFVLLCNKISKC